VLKRRVLFLCSANSVHSPMAEALLDRIDSQNFEVQSAGISCAPVHSLTVEIMKEIGIDLGKKIPRSVQTLQDARFDYAITLDDATAKLYPKFQGVETIHWKIDDPVARSKEPESQLRDFRMVRDQIAQRLRLFVIVHVRPQAPLERTAAVASAAR
jgi:arsenate reductase (thioredoxin)